MADGERLYLVGPDKTMALDRRLVGGKADPVIWTTPMKGGAQTSSPSVCGGLLMAVSDGGTAYCHDCETGRLLWRKPLGAALSFACAGGAYLCSCRQDNGDRRGARYRERPQAARRTHASFALADGRLYIRTKASTPMGSGPRVRVPTHCHR